MPFIRDYSYSTSGATSITSIAVGVPDTATNDLLVAMISADGSLPANTTSVLCTGWTNIGFYSTAGTNAPGMNILVKYATASEPVDYTFTGLGSDTNNGMIISIGDCFYDAGTGANAIENRTASVSVANWTGTAYANLRIGFPAIASTANNSLVLYFGVSSGTATSGGVPTATEGIAGLIIGKDGGSHSDGASWSYKSASGTQAANTTYMRVSGTTSPAGFYAQMVIKPPTGGATIIPPYVVSDASKLINTGTGVADAAGYGANTTGTAANSTVFPVTGQASPLLLNGRPVIAGGTTYTTGDQGVNSFHAGLTITGIVTSGSWGSNVTTHPAMTDLAGANILMHVSPSTPVLGQPVDSVALSGACGFAVGLASTAANCKVWHLHGNGTPWGQARWVPCVINTSNTSGVIGSVGTLATNSITNIGAFLSCKGIAGAYTITSIWKMGITVVAGGNASRPFSDSDLVPTFADSKERRSILSQGAKQYYVVQECQFGNGGTNSIYLKLDDAAFEFPKQYDKNTRNVNYCSVDNKVGMVFYPGASDYISIKNCLFSSSSKFIWGFNASSGAGTVITTGAKVQGAGTITLATNVNISDMIFTSCDHITSANCTMTNIIFDSTTSTADAISITGASQAALQTALDKFVSCTFSNNTVSAGALRIIYTGTAGAIALSMSSGKFTSNTKDIYWEAPAASNLTISLTGGANPSTYAATNANTVTFSQANSFSVSNIVYNSEVRIFNNADSVEIAGVENIGISAASGGSVTGPDTNGRYTFTLTHAYTSNPVFVVVNCISDLGTPATEYSFLRQDYTILNQTQNLPVVQLLDRNFDNP